MMTGPVWPDAVRSVLEEVSTRLTETLGEQLVGLYVFGSLVTGDFDPAVSDLDLLAVLDRDLTESTFGSLDGMHAAVLDRHPEWADRLELIYFTAAALGSFRGQRHPIAAISPGEPFNIKTAEEDWNPNWYVVRNNGVALAGPEPKTLIAPIDIDEVTAQQRKFAPNWVSSLSPASHPGALAYRVLTACRVLHAAENRAMASKSGTAKWARKAMPEWAALVARAQQVRAEGGFTGQIDYGLTRDFLVYAADRLLSGPEAGRIPAVSP